ncbi:MAG TPA: hypothetical protein ENL20_10875 [Candidatus Cloacimonetes bacterium]|nr:hypothetical protein [Candidatus Cloacimonadota bacterium]
MKKTILFTILSILIFPLFSAVGDSLIVQTFTFGDIEKRRDFFDFPDDERTWEKIYMLRTLKCDEQTKQDSFPCGEWDYCTYTLLHIPVNDTVEVFELDNYVTPYGIGLDLNGDCGWTYIYDVTDYAPLLKGRLDISSGSQSELLDLKFVFIEGIPPRDVISVKNLYEWGNYKYEKIAVDSVMKPFELIFDPKASGYKMRARISGHGHFGPRNCCEWDRKTHTYYADESILFRWIIWKNCGDNPIYPQGGTWQFDRAGWCPGTPVDTYDYELTNIVDPGDTIMFDYGIEMYRDNGEKDGMFRQCHQLFSYGKPNFRINAEVYDIIVPSNKDSYSRINPICTNPEIIIRNSGKDPLKTLTIKYGLCSEKKYIHKWFGNLEFLEKENIILPHIDWESPDSIFVVEISKPNGQFDEYPNNDKMTSIVFRPQILPGKFLMHIEAQGLGRAKDNAYTITDDVGKILYEKEGFEDNEIYEELIELPTGCYELKIIDRKEDGMIRQWWYRNSNPGLVGKNGMIEILDEEKNLLKRLKYDFAEAEIFRFRVE